MADDSGRDDQPGGDAQAGAAPVADSISANMAGWIGVTLTGLALLAFAFAVTFNSATSLGFAALTGTSILALGLISLIVLSKAVGIASPLSALGLPPGSIRALLALGLAIVFVSVASWTLGGLFDPMGRLVTQVTVPSDQLDAYRKRYPEADYLFSEIQRSEASAQTELKIYLKRPADAVVDLAKQILTISATVLVTVVGFYFGSNSSAEAVRGMTDTITRLRGGGGAAAPPQPAPPPPNADDLTQSLNTINAIATATKSKLAALGDDPMAALATATGRAANKEAVAAQLIAAQKAFVDLQNAARAVATDASRAQEAGASIRPDMLAAETTQTGQRLQQLLGDAHQAADTFETRLKEFTTVRDAILQG